MSRDTDFTKPEEVELYIQTVELENSYGCLKKNDSDSCERLGRCYLTLRRKFREAAEVFKKCCTDFRHPGCCEYTGDFHALGKGKLAKDTREAFRCYREGCYQDQYKMVQRDGLNDRIGQNCYKMGMHLQLNYDFKEEFMNLPRINTSTDESLDPALSNPPTELHDIFQRACNLNCKNGCFALMELFRTGLDDHIPPDPAKAVHYGEMACNKGSRKACHNLVLMYHNGDGVEKNKEAEEKFAAREKELTTGNCNLKMGQ